MDVCLICLEFNVEKHSRISKNSNEWRTYNIPRVIEKHFWWWHSKPRSDLNENWVCQLCWNQLWSFHSFYLRVEKIHNHYYLQLNQEKVIEDEQSENVQDPEQPRHEEIVEKNEIPLLENLIPIQKRKRGRPRLQDEKMQHIKVEEFSVGVDLEVKDENDSADYEGIKYDEEILENFDKNSESSERSDISDIKTTLNKRRKNRKYTNIRSDSGNNKLPYKSSMSIKLTKTYDEFIAENHELFCSLCHVPLSDFQKLLVHFRDEHNTKAFAMCCGKKFFKRAVFVDHLYIHKDPDYFKCQHCGKVFANRRCLKNHLEWHDDTRKPEFNCKDCGKSFYKRGSFEKHKLLHVPEEERHFQCSECNKRFASASLRTQHLKVTHLNKYAKICDICGKPFRERHAFQRHLAEHTGIPTAPIQCDICGMKLTSTYGLNRHKRLRHTLENMQQQICPYCSKVSPNIAAHRSHIQYSHTMQRKHACHLCEKAFRRPKELKEHLSTHTGEALYTCPYCPRTFISNANMHKHRKSEHPKEWEEARLQRIASSHPPISGE